jgi:hypothetical protein
MKSLVPRLFMALTFAASVSASCDAEQLSSTDELRQPESIARGGDSMGPGSPSGELLVQPPAVGVVHLLDFPPAVRVNRSPSTQGSPQTNPAIARRGRMKGNGTASSAALRETKSSESQRISLASDVAPPLPVALRSPQAAEKSSRR